MPTVCIITSSPIQHNYLLKHDILVKEQFGFMEGLSMDMATYALLNSELILLDKKY
jgi:hypothetical protein